MARCLHGLTGKPVVAISVSIPSVRFWRADLNRYAAETMEAARVSEERLAAGQRET